MANTLTIGASTGHQRMTTSWVLGRLLRDLDNCYDNEMEDEQAHVPPEKIENKGTDILIRPERLNTPAPRTWEALRISVFEFEDNPSCSHGVPALDWVWYTGFSLIILQLIIATLPWILHGFWVTFLVTAAGNTLALLGGSLPQWREEKWACPKKGGATITITKGNGSRHAVVIKGKKGVGLDLEILAQGTRTSCSSHLTRFATIVLASLWLVLLIAVAGLKQYSWCNLPTLTLI
ncbi:hypothetical protein AA0116_g12948 [Alternaria tenuissima]|nr:hypothetical protein AA0116_g12948 [Alternaria tenuissima]